MGMDHTHNMGVGDLIKIIDVSVPREVAQSALSTVSFLFTSPFPVLSDWNKSLNLASLFSSAQRE